MKSLSLTLVIPDDMDDLFNALGMAMRARMEAQKKQAEALRLKLEEIERHRKATQRTFIGDKVRKDLNIVQRMIVFKFLYNLEHTQDVRYY
jgi:archaellum component FlaC